MKSIVFAAMAVLIGSAAHASSGPSKVSSSSVWRDEVAFAKYNYEIRDNEAASVRDVSLLENAREYQDNLSSIAGNLDSAKMTAEVQVYFNKFLAKQEVIFDNYDAALASNKKTYEVKIESLCLKYTGNFCNY